MTIKLGGSEAFKNAQEKFRTALNTEGADQSQAFMDYMEVLQKEVSNKILKQVKNENMDAMVLTGRGQNALTSEEFQFFNAVVQEGGFNDEETLPVTTQERIFEDLTKNYPFLAAIGLQNLGAVTRYIYSDPEFNFAWGKLFGDIKGQVNAGFHEEQIGQLKLTAFAAIPNDMLDLGPAWVERYVRTLLTESYSMGLEYGFINGKGPNSDQPIGLMKDVNAETGAVTDKTSKGKLTFAPSERGEVITGELYGVIKELSVDAKDKQRKVMNKVKMLVNPIDSIAVQARCTIQTSTGQWVTSLPYNIQVVESEEIPVGKALFFVAEYYTAALAGGYQMKKFDQTLAFEDATLYTIKQFANGKPKDNKTALLYDLDIDFAPLSF